MQKLVLEGNIAEAEEMTAEKILHKGGAKYLPVGSISMKFDGDFSHYERILDLANALAEVTYRSGGVQFKREYFTSFPDSCIAIKITADKPKSVSFTLSAETPFRQSFKESGGMLVMQGEAPQKIRRDDDKNIVFTYSDDPASRGICFTTAVKVIADNAKYVHGDIVVEHSNEAVILIGIETNYNGFSRSPFTDGKEHEKRCLEHIASLADYNRIKDTHTKDFSALYHRASLNLGGAEKNGTTDARLAEFDGSDLGLYELIFNVGRYLLISSSRPGTQAANLQGIWNEKTMPPWSSSYTVNINTEMNYWPAFTANLAECFEPFLELLEKMRATGRVTAEKIYGASGFTAFHNTDIWGKTSPVENAYERISCRHAYWNMAAGWMAVQLYDLYDYTRDKEILKNRIYPLMKDAAQFLMDIMIEDENGCSIVCPSSSPENNYLLDGDLCALAKTTTMTVSIIKELFDRLQKASEILEDDAGFIGKIKKMKLPELKGDSEGRLLEWDREVQEDDRHHRHVSHLFSLFPGELIDPETTPELAAMCQKSLEARGDEGTGWSLAWKVNLYAMLRLGDRALDILKNQLNLVHPNDVRGSYEGGTYANMLCAHPPFQIDGNFGAAAGIINMLLQSKAGKITLLPALPKAWKEGSFKGLVAKGNIAVNAAWQEGSITELSLVSPVSQQVEVIAGEKRWNVTLHSGQELKIR